ncbi:MAG: Mur ligase family protein [Prevotella sp.]|nr:Mur ligase family protein [Staphylococcus sp.]MCM1350513.1 Mur ligase family protein [Prevotella sp.]
MKLETLKQQLQEQIQGKTRKVKRVSTTLTKAKATRSPLTIIGITGSTGKSTTAYILHQYLKQQGYKSVLYSSICVDSPASYIQKEEAYEVAVSSKEALLSIIEETEAYGAEYLVLEINESTIAKGIVKDVPFDVRVLTNLNPKHNLETYPEEEYVNIKKSFFQDIEDECICVYGLQDYDKALWEELLSINDYPKMTCSSNYIANVKGVETKDITCLLQDLDKKETGMNFTVKIKDQTYQFHTKDQIKYQVMNHLTALTVIQALDVFDEEAYQNCIEDIHIPGRAVVYEANGRTIIVDLHLPKMLSELITKKERKEIQQIKVVVGSIGTGFQTWEERFNNEEAKKTRQKVRQYAMELIKGKVEYVYLTESDNASDSVLDICKELKGYLGETLAVIIEDREEAIRQAILESKRGDAILISGRGNRRILCNTATTMKLVKDSEVVEQVLKELGW